MGLWDIFSKAKKSTQSGALDFGVNDEKDTTICFP